MRKVESQDRASGHRLLPMNRAKHKEHLGQLVARFLDRYRLYPLKQVDICGLREEAEEKKVLFENGGDVKLRE